MMKDDQNLKFNLTEPVSTVETISTSSESSKAEGNTKTSASPSIKWCFTLNNYTPEEENKLKVMVEKECKFCVCGHEVGEKGTPHLQGYLEFKRKIRFNQVKILLGSRYHIEKAKGSKWDNITYCEKDGDSWKYPTPREPKVLKYNELRKWQKIIVDICKTEPDDRTINWFYDNGNTGKTSVCKYIFKYHKCIIANGKANDIKHAISSYFENWGFYPEIIIWTAPRVAKNYINYGALEEIKDGLIFSGKYESNCFLMPTPHVFVFCNFEPDTEKLTSDRWNIVNVDEINNEVE